MLFLKNIWKGGGVYSSSICDRIRLNINNIRKRFLMIIKENIVITFLLETFYVTFAEKLNVI